MQTSYEDWVAIAQDWVNMDPNETTSAHVQSFINENNTLALESIFCNRIAFGTAGLRASMQPGPNSMNDLVVVQTAQGVARACQEEFGKNAKQNRLKVVIGFDHRAAPQWKLSSQRFALLSALVFQKAELDVFLLHGYVATPLVPFAISESDSSATIGIMITASHNPKQDAGYKIYWNNGCQIRTPTDSLISRCILQNLIPWMDYGRALKDRQSHYKQADICCGLSKIPETQALIQSYFKSVKKRLWTNQVEKYQSEHSPPKFCYTSMHGVGYRFARQIFSEFDFPAFLSVGIQQEPDATFPTVNFPNPEEKGALELAKNYACTKSCDIVLANDPDADRLAVAERDRQTHVWTVFKGDEIGVLLASWLYSIHNNPDTIPVVCASTVSSRMVAEMARVEGFRFEETLTGFKWIGSKANELDGQLVPGQPGKRYQCILCYEEAIGFCCGNVIFDKDGISAIAVMAELCYHLYSQGQNLKQHLQSLYKKYGEFVSHNDYFIVDDPSVVGGLLEKLLTSNKIGPGKAIGKYVIASVRYLNEKTTGFDTAEPDGRPKLPSTTTMLTIRFENGCIAQFRASGTEPKFKYYFENKGDPGIQREDVANELDAMVSVVLEQLWAPAKNGLKYRGKPS